MAEQMNGKNGKKESGESKPIIERSKPVIVGEEVPMDNVQYKYMRSLQRHIGLVIQAAEKLGERLIEEGKDKLGKILIANSYRHDHSKFFGVEWEYLVRGDDEDRLKLAVHQHVTTNPHHPEYWDDINDMPKIYLAEMTCDIFARSAEFGTDLRSYVKNQLLTRYNITTSTKSYKTIKLFIDLLLDEPFENIRKKKDTI